MRGTHTKFLCGNYVEWEKGNCLRSSNLLPVFRKLHHIFVHNVYPRAGNHTELTPYMVEVLYRVGKQEMVCLPSIVLTQMLKPISTSRPLNLPFGRLACQLAKQFGLATATSRLVDFNEINTKNVGRLKDNVPQGPRAGPSNARLLDESESEEEHESEDEEDVAEDEDEDYQPTAGLEERIVALERAVAAGAERQERWNKRLYRKMQEILCCIQKEDAPPPSPASLDH